METIPEPKALSYLSWLSQTHLNSLSQFVKSENSIFYAIPCRDNQTRALQQSLFDRSGQNGDFQGKVKTSEIRQFYLRTAISLQHKLLIRSDLPLIHILFAKLQYLNLSKVTFKNCQFVSMIDCPVLEVLSFSDMDEVHEKDWVSQRFRSIQSLRRLSVPTLKTINLNHCPGILNIEGLSRAFRGRLEGSLSYGQQSIIPVNDATHVAKFPIKVSERASRKEDLNRALGLGPHLRVQYTKWQLDQALQQERNQLQCKKLPKAKVKQIKSQVKRYIEDIREHDFMSDDSSFMKMDDEYYFHVIPNHSAEHQFTSINGSRKKFGYCPKEGGSAIIQPTVIQSFQRNSSESDLEKQKQQLFEEPGQISEIKKEKQDLQEHQENSLIKGQDEKRMDSPIKDLVKNSPLEVIKSQEIYQPEQDFDQNVLQQELESSEIEISESPDWPEMPPSVRVRYCLRRKGKFQEVSSFGISTRILVMVSINQFNCHPLRSYRDLSSWDQFELLRPESLKESKEDKSSKANSFA